MDKLNWTRTHKPTECFHINFDGEVLQIPFRIYYEEPVQQNLTENESLILDCIFTRHHNGYIREKRLNGIIDSHRYLAAPFIAQLLGEYVLEILMVIKDSMTETLVDNLVRLKAENPTFFNKTEQRVQSYWYCYYKEKFPKKVDYAGFQILNEIENRTQNFKVKNIA